MREVSSERWYTFSCLPRTPDCPMLHAGCTIISAEKFSHLRIRIALLLPILRKKYYLYHCIQQVTWCPAGPAVCKQRWTWVMWWLEAVLRIAVVKWFVFSSWRSKEGLQQNCCFGTSRGQTLACSGDWLTESLGRQFWRAKWYGKAGCSSRRNS